jgi:hypothetical protein
MEGLRGSWGRRPPPQRGCGRPSARASALPPMSPRGVSALLALSKQRRRMSAFNLAASRVQSALEAYLASEASASLRSPSFRAPAPDGLPHPRDSSFLEDAWRGRESAHGVGVSLATAECRRRLPALPGCAVRSRCIRLLFARPPAPASPHPHPHSSYSIPARSPQRGGRRERRPHDGHRACHAPVPCGLPRLCCESHLVRPCFRGGATSGVPSHL